MAANEKYLILGSNSFSGATFVDFLAAAGHDVIATSRSDEPHEAFLPYKWQKRPGNVRFKRVDLNHDLDALKALLAVAQQECRRSQSPTHSLACPAVHKPVRVQTRASPRRARARSSRRAMH